MCPRVRASKVVMKMPPLPPPGLGSVVLFWVLKAIFTKIGLRRKQMAFLCVLLTQRLTQLERQQSARLHRDGC